MYGYIAFTYVSATMMQFWDLEAAWIPTNRDSISSEKGFSVLRSLWQSIRFKIR